MTDTQYTAQQEANDRYISANQYVRGIQAIQNSPHHNFAEFFLPVHMLLGYSLELYFKAWLLADGISSKELASRKYGHKLMALLDECFRRGIAGQESVDQFFTRNLQGLVDLAEQGHTSASNFTFRYFDSRRRYKGMNQGQDIQVLATLDQLVRQKVKPNTDV